MPAALESRLRDALPADAAYASARLSNEHQSYLSVRAGVVEPTHVSSDTGVMFTVWLDGGLGYGATSDLSDAGLRQAVEQARHWASVSAGRSVVHDPPLDHRTGSFESPVEQSWADVSLADRIDLLRQQSERMRVDPRIVDDTAALWWSDIDTLMLTNGGGRIEQRFHQVFPSLDVVANEGSNTQTRSYGGGAYAGQGGVEVLERHGFGAAAERLGHEVIELLLAPNCPEGRMDIVLAPDQMVLQIHESIGHPLELDRILGDERNYAGTTFVTPDMFGSYQYGSSLLDVTFDPTVPGQLASYGFDDDGTPATRQFIIEHGILQRPLGGTLSQHRAGMDGVANSRACSWNRPPIDRMANLNVEPGDSSFGDLVGGIERGVYMETNVSWSIDDSRNKFQFGCEYGRVIENGVLGHVVRNPNYRGISESFWRSLTGVGDASLVSVMGTPNCGKGEPNQEIRVGHASPPCRFSDVQVFGGAA